MSDRKQSLRGNETERPVRMVAGTRDQDGFMGEIDITLSDIELADQGRTRSAGNIRGKITEIDDQIQVHKKKLEQIQQEMNGKPNRNESKLRKMFIEESDAIRRLEDKKGSYQDKLKRLST